MMNEKEIKNCQDINELASNPISRITLSWLQPLFAIGSKQRIEFEHLPQVRNAINHFAYGAYQLSDLTSFHVAILRRS